MERPNAGAAEVPTLVQRDAGLGAIEELVDALEEDVVAVLRIARELGLAGGDRRNEIVALRLPVTRCVPKRATGMYGGRHG